MTVLEINLPFFKRKIYGWRATVGFIGIMGFLFCSIMKLVLWITS